MQQQLQFQREQDTRFQQQLQLQREQDERLQQQLQLQREQDERHQQQLQLQREQDKRHQDMMQLLLTLNVGDNASQNRHFTAPFPQSNHQSLNSSQISEGFFLSFQPLC